MARLTTADDIPSGPASVGDTRPSIWSAIHPRLLELIRAHRSTLIFVNSRRLAERLAGALNELAGETLVRSHHGSIARPQRVEIEDLLKAGALRALVATSSLELGIDMGAIDLVVQIEAPPSVASGLQRIGRGGHQANAVSEGVIFPKFRGDLVACAAVAKAMHDGAVEATRYPRNPLDIVAQQVVAMASMDDWDVDELFATIRRAAPFAELSRTVFDGVLDMLSGRYPSDEFAELRPRVTWDRVAGTVVGARRRQARGDRQRRHDSRPRAVRRVPRSAPARARRASASSTKRWCSRAASARRSCSAPRRGGSRRSRTTACSSRRRPGEPGKMPFWKGDRAGRPLELGLAIGRLMHDLLRLPPAAAIDRLTREHDLDRARRREPAAVPARSDGGRRAPCPTRRRSSSSACATSSATGASACCRRAAAAFTRRGRWRSRRRSARRPASTSRRCGETTGSWCGFRTWTSRRIRGCCCPIPTKCRRWSCGSSGRRRCSRRSSARTPRARCCCRSAGPACARRSGSSASAPPICWRSPRATDRFRCCSKPIASACATSSTCRRWSRRSADVRSRKIRVATVDSETPSPFAASLLFSYVASFLYDGDAPLAERRAQALAVDQAQLRELLGDAELRELLDADVDGRGRAAAAAARSAVPRARAPTACTTCCCRSAISTRDEIAARDRSTPDVAGERRRAGRGAARAAGPHRRRAALHRGRGRGALPRRARRAAAGRHSRIAARSRCAIRSATSRCATRARTRRSPPPTSRARYGLAPAAAEAVLRAADRRGPAARRRVPARRHAARVDRRRRAAACCGAARWPSCGTRSSRSISRCSAGSRRPGRAIVKRRHGADALLDAIEQLQGAPLPASILETEILPARIDVYDPADLDAVTAAGEVVWVGVEPLGERDGRIALYLADHLPRLLPPDGREPARRTHDGRPSRTLDPSARSRSSNICAIARRVVLRAAARGGRRRLSRRRPSTRCGISSGAAWSPTTRSTRCARSRARARRGDRRRRRREPTSSRSDRGGWRRRRPKAAGRWSGRRERRGRQARLGPRRHEVGRGHRRSSCSRGTACSRARRWPPKRCPAASARSIRC